MKKRKKKEEEKNKKKNLLNIKFGEKLKKYKIYYIFI